MSGHQAVGMVQLSCCQSLIRAGSQIPAKLIPLAGGGMEFFSFLKGGFAIQLNGKKIAQRRGIDVPMTTFIQRQDQAERLQLPKIFIGILPLKNRVAQRAVKRGKDTGDQHELAKLRIALFMKDLIQIIPKITVIRMEMEEIIVYTLGG